MRKLVLGVLLFTPMAMADMNFPAGWCEISIGYPQDNPGKLVMLASTKCSPESVKAALKQALDKASGPL